MISSRPQGLFARTLAPSFGSVEGCFCVGLFRTLARAARPVGCSGGAPVGPDVVRAYFLVADDSPAAEIGSYTD